MLPKKLCLLCVCLTGFAAQRTEAQTNYVELSPTGSQTITQPAGTVLQINGYVGIGTGSAISDLTLGSTGTDPNPNTGAERYYANGGLTFLSTGYVLVGRVAPVQETGFYVDRSDLALSVGLGGNTELEVMRLQSPTGNVGIGTTTPGAKLEVNGNVKLTSGSGASITFPDSTIQSTAWNGVLSGGDYAESVDVEGDRERYEPGDVLVIDTASEGKFLRSAQPYSTSVTGVYSTKPGLVGRRQLTDRSHMKDEVPLAMTGIVPIKVSAENGAIKAGDLLVTSSTPGYAMKGTDRSQMLGAVIGKALGHLDSGLGIIEGVVTLQ